MKYTIKESRLKKLIKIEEIAITNSLFDKLFIALSIILILFFVCTVFIQNKYIVNLGILYLIFYVTIICFLFSIKNQIKKRILKGGN